jgi:hypothetical protein
MSDFVQPFPGSGELADNCDLSLPNLKRRVHSAVGEVHSYVVRSVKLNRATQQFAQKGSAPNFQGGYVTLCTCKHQMRATQPADTWRGTWIAGFASRCLDHHWLFYLVQIAEACESQYDLWEFLSAKPNSVLETKSSLNESLGDVFQPKRVLHGKDRFDPACYHAPKVTHSHRQDGCDSSWRNDIRYRHARRYQRYPLLLVGDPAYSFLWRKPALAFKGIHTRNFARWNTVDAFLRMLEEPG